MENAKVHPFPANKEESGRFCPENGMNTLYLSELMKKEGYPNECISSLIADYGALLGHPVTKGILRSYSEEYAAGKSFSFYDASCLLAEQGRQAGVHPYASEILFYLHLAPILQENYRQEGIPDRYFSGMMQGILCKLYECHGMYDIWGSFVSVWFARFFNRSLYAIGRFEFCLMNSPADYEVCGKRVKKGQPLIDVHIPSRGRLSEQEMVASYAEAADFFKKRAGLPEVVFHCESWLLADFHEEFLREDGGIRLFAHRYAVVERTPDEGDLWRIFYKDADLPPEALPEDTALKRGYKKRLLLGKELYGGRGLFVYDEKVPPESEEND